MRKPLIPPSAAVLFFLYVSAAPIAGQAPNGVGNGGETRPRRSGRPAPRSADGRALLGNTPEQKGVWLPENPFIPNALGLPAAPDLPFQPWARALHANRQANPAERTYYGHSVGRREGDTLVVDTVGFNERFWFDRSGLGEAASVDRRSPIVP